MRIATVTRSAAMLAALLAASGAAQADVNAPELDARAESAAEAAVTASGAATAPAADDGHRAAAVPNAGQLQRATAPGAAQDSDENAHSRDELTVSDMVGETIAESASADDDGGANEAAEAAALTPTQAEADSIAAAYVDAALYSVGGEGAALAPTAGRTRTDLPATASTNALQADDPAMRSKLDPETDSSRLRRVLALSAPPPVANGAAAAVGAKPVTVRAVRVTALQRALKARGFAVTVDGELGPDTTVALRAFQRKNGLQASGKLDAASAQSLGVKF